MSCALVAVGLMILFLFLYYYLPARTVYDSSNSSRSRPSPAPDALWDAQQDELDEMEEYNRNHDRDGTPYGAIEDMFMAEDEEGE